VVEQGVHQGQAAGVAVGRALPVGGRRGQVDHPVGHARQAFEAGRIVEVAHQGRDATGAQQANALGRRGQGHQAHALALRGAQLARGAQAHIATAHDQDTLAAKAGRQCAQRGLV